MKKKNKYKNNSKLKIVYLNKLKIIKNFQIQIMMMKRFLKIKDK